MLGHSPSLAARGSRGGRHARGAVVVGALLFAVAQQLGGEVPDQDLLYCIN